MKTLPPKLVKLAQEWEVESESFKRLSKRYVDSASSLSELCTVFYNEADRHSLTIDQVIQIYKSNEDFYNRRASD